MIRAMPNFRQPKTPSQSADVGKSIFATPCIESNIDTALAPLFSFDSFITNIDMRRDEVALYRRYRKIGRQRFNYLPGRAIAQPQYTEPIIDGPDYSRWRYCFLGG